MNRTPFHRGMRAAAVAVVLSIAACAAPAAVGGQDDSELFALTRVHTIHLRLSAAAWNTMQPTRAPRFAPRPQQPPAATVPAARSAGEGERLPPGPFGLQYAWVRAAIEFNGEALEDVGVRCKGNSSFVLAGASPRKPFKIDFNRFRPGRKFHGVANLNLNNAAIDPSQMREALSLAVFRDAGVPAPRSAFAMVYLTVEGVYDREFLGLYTIIEEVDRAFLKSRFGESSGLLLKPEGVRGMPYLGDDANLWADRYNPRTSVRPEHAARFVEFLELLNRADDDAFRARIAEYVDIDAFLRYLAANALMSNMDSPLCTGHNYYLYLCERDGRLRWIPWDLNLSFGSFTWTGTIPQLMDLSLSRPHLPPNRLIDRLLAIEDVRREYQRLLKEFTAAFFNARSLSHRVESIRPLLRQVEQIARQLGKTGSPATMPARGPFIVVPDLEAFIAGRLKSVQSQLAGASAGYMPGVAPDSPLARAWFDERNEAQVRANFAAILRAADTNADNRLFPDELLAAAGALWKHLDPAGAGRVDLWTIQRALARLLPLPPVVVEPGPGLVWGRALFALADADGDGALTREEWTRSVLRAFRDADHNGDAALDQKELYDALMNLAAPAARK